MYLAFFHAILLFTVLWSVMWWFYNDKNSAVTVAVLYLPIQKCKQSHCMESIYIK